MLCILHLFLAEGVFNLLVVTVWNVMMEALILHTRSISFTVLICHV